MFSVFSAKRDSKELHVTVQAGDTKLVYKEQRKRPGSVELAAYPASFIEALGLTVDKQVSAEFNFDPTSEHGGIVYPEGKSADLVRIGIPDLTDKAGNRVYEATFRCRKTEAEKLRDCLVGLWSDKFIDPSGRSLLGEMDNTWHDIGVKIINLSTPLCVTPREGDEVELTFSFAMAGVDGEELANMLTHVLLVKEARLEGESIIARLRLGDEPLHFRIENVCQYIKTFTRREVMGWHSVL